MKKMNKLTAAVLAAAMVGTMAMPVFADDNDYTGTGDSTKTRSTTVVYAVTEGYTWTVPAKIDFGNDAGAGSKVVEKTVENDNSTLSKVTVKSNKIGDQKMLRITAAGSGSANAFTIANGNTTLSYVITTTSEKKDDTETSGYTGKTITVADNTLLDLNAGLNTAEVGLKFTLTTTSAKAETAGNYEGTVTYTASIVNQTT